MYAFVDGGFSGIERSSKHSYIIMNENRKIVRKRKFRGFEKDSMCAELRSIEKLLQDLIHEDVQGMVIYSDCKPLINAINNGDKISINCDYLKFLLKKSGTTLQWIPRGKNRNADKLVHSIGKPKIKSGLLIK